LFDARQSNMQDVTTYAPVRIALLGIVRAIFGLLVAVMGWLRFGLRPPVTALHGSRATCRRGGCHLLAWRWALAVLLLLPVAWDA